MPSHDTCELEALAAEGRWVRRLALGLARDVHDAEDVEQDTWLAALRRKPIEPGALASWCCGVVRNLVRYRKRAEANRADRERRTARSAMVDGPEDVLERLEARELLVRAVRGLREPYRTTVLLHWFDGLAPAEIARRTGVPVRTVHTRLGRSVQLLRERLDRPTSAARPNWLPAIAPLIASSPRSWVSCLIMNAKVGVGIGATVIAILAAAWLLPTHQYAPGQAAQVGSAAPGSLGNPDSPAERPFPGLDSGNRTLLTDVPGSRPPEESAAVREIEGTVIDPQGETIGDVELRFLSYTGDSASDTVRSNSAGMFRIPEPATTGSIVAASETWATVLSPQVRNPYQGGQLVLVVAPRIFLEGVVVDEQHNPLPGMRVSHVPPDLRGQLDFVLDSSRLLASSVQSDDRGRFHMDGVPAIEGAELRTRDELLRHAEDVRAAPTIPDAGLEIMLKPLDQSLLLLGRVVDADRSGIPGAWVALGKQTVHTDPAGEFRLDLRGEDPARTIRVAKEGLLPAQVECSGTSVRTPGAWPDPLVIVLDGEPLTITGRVLNPGGAGVPGARVLPLDRTPFGQVYQTAGVAPDGLPRWGGGDLESLTAGRPFDLECSASDEGSFELPGLLPRSYRLLVFDPATKALLETQPIRAGTHGLELRLPGSAPRGRVAGHVLDRRGRPVEGARVEPLRPLPDLPVWAPRDLSGGPIRTDARGAFELKDLPSEVDRLVVSLEPSPTKNLVFIDREKDPEAIEVVVPRPCHLRVDLTTSRIDAGMLEVQDALGGSLPIISRKGTSSQSITAATRNGPARHFLSLRGRQCEAFAVDETAYMLILYNDEHEVLRIPLDLPPSTVTTVRP